MIFVSVTQFHVHLTWVYAHLAVCLNRFLNVKTVVGTFNFNKENALVGAFSSVIVKTSLTFASSSSGCSAH